MSTPVNTDTPEHSSESQQQIDFEKRYKDTQAAYTKSQQELKAVKAKVDVLEKLTTPQIQIDAEAQKELDDLKYSDPDAWRTKMNNLELDARSKHQNLISAAEQQAAIQAEMDRRTQVLNEYNRSHPGFEITDEVIQLDVPTRITKKLESGELSFDDFLGEVKEFLYAPKKVGTTNKTVGQPNLGNLGGGDTPSDTSISKDIVANYKNIAY